MKIKPAVTGKDNNKEDASHSFFKRVARPK
jgi:hypothetical protein